MSQNSNLKEDEIDPSELFAALWSQKLLITLFTSLFIFLAGYYTLVAEKKFTVQAIFQIEEFDSNSNFNLPNELGALASLAGLSSGNRTSNIDMLLERANGREFIIAMNTKFLLESDLHFNPYDSNYQDPFWKATIKKIIGWQKSDLEKSNIIERNILKNYRKNVFFEITDSGAISISVTHIDPQKASNYANNFMEEIRKLVENESTSAQALRLNYLSETLADALQEMELAQETLKNYALENSALAQENFISDSLKLDEIRMEKRKVGEIADLLFVIENLIKSQNLDGSSYEMLRTEHPLVDDIEFRRILGMSETISAWTWPELETIEAISATLRDRIKRLNVDIKNIEENAQIYATSAEDLAKFTRNAKIAEATYTVLIEQVKSQALAAGFQPETFKVFEYATPAIAQIYPNRVIVLVLGALLGILLGSTVAVISSIFRGVYYARSTLISDANPELSLQSQKIRRLSRKSIPDIVSYISHRRTVVLDEATLKLANRKIVYVLNCGGRPTATNLARLLASKSAKAGRNVLLCDISGRLKEGIKDKSTSNNSNLQVVNLGSKIDMLTNASSPSFFTSADFSSTIKDLTKRYDQVFFCSGYNHGQLGLMALTEFTPSLVVIASLRRTKKLFIKRIKTRQTIELFFYD